MTRLARRAVDLSTATPDDQANIAFDALGIVSGIVILALAIIAVVRTRYGKAPYIVLIVAAILFTFSEAFALGSYLENFDVEDPFDTQNIVAPIVIGLGAISTLLGNWSIALIIASAFHLLYSRARASNVPYHISRKVLNWIVIGLLIFLGGLSSIIVGVAQGLFDVQNVIDFDQFENLVNVSTDVSYVQLALTGVLLIDFLISAIIAHLKIKERATLVLIVVWWPILFVQFIFSLFTAVYFAININIDSDTALNIDAANNGIFLFFSTGAMITIAAIGISSPGGANPFAPRMYNGGYGQQPMYYAGPQPMYGQAQQQYPSQQAPYQHTAYQQAEQPAQQPVQQSAPIAMEGDPEK